MIAVAGRRLCSLLVLGVLCACAGTGAAPVPSERPQPVASAFLVSHGWHAGIVIRLRDPPEHFLPERRDFPEAEYLEFGWGDRDFYQAREFSLPLAMQAAFTSRSSVLHVVGFRDEPSRYFVCSELVEFRLSSRQLEQLASFVHTTFAREGSDAVAPLGRGLYGESRFYPASGRFHLFNTCNTWAANALLAASYPFEPVNTVDRLLAQARRLGRVIASPATCSE